VNRHIPSLPFGLARYTLGQIASGALILLAVIVLPLVDRDSAHISAVADAGYILLLALGLNVVVGYTGLLVLGYAAFFAAGAYAYAMLASPQFNIHVAFWPMLLVSALVAAFFGVLIGAPTLRLRGDYLAIVTLGFGQIVPDVLLNLDKYTGGPNGISAIDQPVLFGYRFGFNPTPYYYVYLVVIVLSLIVLSNLRHSRLGRAWMAVREDELAAAHMGINTTTAKLLAFSFSAAFAGLAGCIYAAKLALVIPNSFEFQLSVLVLLAVVLGGLGNLAGVLLGGAIIALLNFFVLPQASNWVHAIGDRFGLAALQSVDLTNYRFLIFGAILVLVMLFRPEGLLPSATVRAELHQAQAAEPDAGAG
jgi:branched-chain amino acid transport system permease protein